MLFTTILTVKMFSNTQNLGTDKKSKWASFVKNWINDEIVIGSPRPVKGAPTWVTLEVLSGGIASGTFLAALPKNSTPNEHYLSEKGVLELSEMLETGNYRVQYPEHGALLVIVWLLQQHRVFDAEEILKEITPWFSKLQFYPFPAETPINAAPIVSVSTVGDATKSLNDYVVAAKDITRRSVQRRMSMRRMIDVWRPFQLKLIELFLLTCECDHYPKFNKKEQLIYVQYPECPKHNKEHGCGWPLQIFPEEWHNNAKKLLAKYNKLIKEEDKLTAYTTPVFDYGTRKWESVVKHIELNKRFRRKGSLMDTLITYLRAYADLKALNGMQVGRLRMMLASWERKRGYPNIDTAKGQEWQLLQRKISTQLSQSNVTTFAEEMLVRLDQSDTEIGLYDTEAFLKPVLVNGVNRKMPEWIRRLIKKTQMGTLTELIDAGLVSSSESMAKLVPQLVACCIINNDPTTRLMEYAILMAFSKRRSLLLKNLAHQATVEDLPWMKHLLSARENKNEESTALETLKYVLQMTFKNFPHTILPNKLVQSLQQLVKRAGTYFPLVNELASDIFEGQFSSKFIDAANFAAINMKNTLYEMYFGLTDIYNQLTDSEDEDLINLCEQSAGVKYCGLNSSNSNNGKLIEQQQIFTTHNLTLLLKFGVDLDWLNLAQDTWRWIVESMSNVPYELQPRLRLRKNVAYAWRQFIFYMSQLPKEKCINELKTLTSSGSNVLEYGYCVNMFLKPLITTIETNTQCPKPVLGWADNTEGFFPCKNEDNRDQ